MPTRFNGKVSVVTGGASGIGEGIVRRLVAEGGRCLIADVQEERGHALAPLDARDVRGGAAVEGKLGLAQPSLLARFAQALAALRGGTVQPVQRVGATAADDEVVSLASLQHVVADATHTLLKR